MQKEFIQRRSTTSLTIFIEYMSSKMDKTGQVDVIYIDFSKALTGLTTP